MRDVSRGATAAAAGVEEQAGRSASYGQACVEGTGEGWRARQRESVAWAECSTGGLERVRVASGGRVWARGRVGAVGEVRQLGTAGSETADSRRRRSAGFKNVGGRTKQQQQQRWSAAPGAMRCCRASSTGGRVKNRAGTEECAVCSCECGRASGRASVRLGTGRLLRLRLVSSRGLGRDHPRQAAPNTTPRPFEDS